METKMTAPTVGEINKVIAIFCGNKEYEKDGVKWYLNESRLGWPIDDLRYHDSWTWLMPVVEKIEMLGYYTLIYRSEDLNEMQIWDGTPTYKRTEKNLIVHSKIGKYRNKIDAIHRTVYDFILWYNSISSPNGAEPGTT